VLFVHLLLFEILDKRSLGTKSRLLYHFCNSPINAFAVTGGNSGDPPTHLTIHMKLQRLGAVVAQEEVAVITVYCCHWREKNIRYGRFTISDGYLIKIYKNITPFLRK
jgi:hypothetical protein